MDTLLAYLPILLALVAIAVAWGRYEQKLGNQQRQIDALERKHEASVAADAAHKQQIAAALEAIRISIVRLEEAVAALRRAG